MTIVLYCTVSTLSQVYLLLKFLSYQIGTTVLIYCSPHFYVISSFNTFRVIHRHCETLAGFVKARDDYKCFNVDDPGGLVVTLQDLMSCEDEELRICSANLLYAIYKVI